MITGSNPVIMPSGGYLQTADDNLMVYGPDVTTFSLGNVTTTSEGGTTTVLVYRGVSGGQFVFSEGSPPVGATDITIIGSK